MSHVFFFSYTHDNLDKELKAFFRDLCNEVAPHTEWGRGDDPRTSFRDGQNLPLMVEWNSAILDAIQSSSILVCVTSPAYFVRPFCGQEFWVFDQRRRQSVQPGTKPPPVVLPIIWTPVDGGIPPFMDNLQETASGMPDIYRTKGLRYLKRLDPNAYDRCVTAFADAIQTSWRRYPAIPPLAAVHEFDQIPNAFAGGHWDEAADSGGWRAGPDVANFVFVAARKDEVRAEGPAGRYGNSAADWRPFLPPVPKTISEIARDTARKHRLRYREIFVTDQLHVELAGAQQRKNLTLVLVDVATLEVAEYDAIRDFDSYAGEGNALLVPWNEPATRWNAAALPALKTSFPIRAQLTPPAFQAPICSVDEMDRSLDVTLADLRGALTRVETEKKPKTDDAPAQVVGPGDGAS
jgi:FxsC-like protein